MRVLRTQGIESEAPLAFAALQRLLRPLMPLAEALPAQQAKALRVAFGMEAGEGAGDRFLVFLAALSLLAEASETQPLLVVVDDAHWLDDASAAALLFVARRLEVERVAMLFAARELDVRTFDCRRAAHPAARGTGPGGDHRTAPGAGELRREPGGGRSALGKHRGQPARSRGDAAGALVGPAGRPGEPARAASGHRDHRAGLPRPSPTALARCAAAAARGCRGRLDAARHRGECRGRHGRRPGRPGRGGALRPRAGHRGQGRAEAPARPVRAVRRRHEHRPPPRARRPGRCPASSR